MAGTDPGRLQRIFDAMPVLGWFAPSASASTRRLATRGHVVPEPSPTTAPFSTWTKYGLPGTE